MTFGRMITERRMALRITLAGLGRRLAKQDGSPVSAQYLHDIQNDRRLPGPAVLASLARVLEIPVDHLGALAGICPANVLAYLADHHDAAPAVARLFQRAKAARFSSWDAILPVEATAAAARVDPTSPRRAG